ncbi:MAG: protein kinase domain-containing protein [Limnospira sp.]
MSYCLNPLCPAPENSPGSHVCSNCGSSLLLDRQYRAVQNLGGGGMSRTFLGVDERRSRTSCILKQFSPQQQNFAAVQKATDLFHQEAMRLQELGNHPQIPHLYASLESEGRLYLVQEYIEGENLLQELELGKPFGEETVRELLWDLLPILQFIHHHQVVHRDIKPENIIRRRQDGHLVLVDFGVAKHEIDILHPKTGTMTGTIGYAPLEQIRGGKAYPASDLYSLGITCIHLLTGIAPGELFDPFTGELIWRSHLERTGRSIGPPLNRILNKLLADWVKDRYQCAEEVLQDLRPAPHPSRPLQIRVAVELATRQAEFAHQQPIWGVPPPQSFGVGIFSGSPSPPPISIPLLNCNCGGQLGFDEIVPPKSPETWRCGVVLKGHSAPVRAIAIGPDGYLLISSSADRTIRLWNLCTGQLLHRFCGHAAAVNAIALSPNGRRLVSGSCDRTLLAWNLKTRAMTDRFFSHSGSPYSHRSGPINAVAYSPDGRIVASCGADPTIKLWNQRNGELLYRLREHCGPVFCVTFVRRTSPTAAAPHSWGDHPQSSLFASGGADGQIKIWRFGLFNSLYTLAGHSGAVGSVAFGPDPNLLASAGADGTVKLWDFQRENLLATLPAPGGTTPSIAISPDGKMLAWGGGDGTVCLWILDPPEFSTNPTFQLAGYGPVAFGADSRTLICNGGNSEIWVWHLGED